MRCVSKLYFYVKNLYRLKLVVNVYIYFSKNVHLSGISKIPCGSRIDSGDARFTGVSMVFATRSLAVVTLISGPGRDVLIV